MNFFNFFKFVGKYKSIFFPIIIILLIFLLIDYFMSGNSLTPIGYNIY